MLRFLERKPLTAPTLPAKAPLLLLLHGYGSHEADLFSLAEVFSPEFYVLSLRAPILLGQDSYGWFPLEFTPQGPVHDQAAAAKSTALVVAFIEKAVATLPVDPARVWLVGFSQGAIISTSVLLTRPELIAGVVAWSGRTLPEVLPTPPGPAALAGKPILVLHGTDDRVLPIHHGRASRDALCQLPLALTYEEFAMGHEVSDESLEVTRDWLAERVSSGTARTRSSRPV